MPSKYDSFKDLIIAQEVPDEIIARMIGKNCTRSAIRSARNRFLNPKKNEKYRRNWRKENPEKFRAQCKRYREKSSVTAKKHSCQKEREFNSDQNNDNDFHPIITNKEIGWMQWEDDLILNSGKPHKELSEYLELPKAKIKRREFYLLDKERRMQKKAEIPLACGPITGSGDLQREVERARNLISTFKEDLDWENDRDLKNMIVSSKKSLYQLIKGTEEKFEEMRNWSDEESKNRDLLIIPFFNCIYKAIEKAYESKHWTILYIKK